MPLETFSAAQRVRHRIGTNARRFRRVQKLDLPEIHGENDDVLSILFPREVRNRQRVDNLAKDLEQKLSLEFDGMSSAQRMSVIRALRPDLAVNMSINESGTSVSSPNIPIVMTAEDSDESHEQQLAQQQIQQAQAELAANEFPVEIVPLVSTGHKGVLEDEQNDDSIEGSHDSIESNSVMDTGSSSRLNGVSGPAMLFLGDHHTTSSANSSRRPSMFDSPAMGHEGKVQVGGVSSGAGKRRTGRTQELRPSEKYGSAMVNPSTPSKNSSSKVKDKKGEASLKEMRGVTMDLEAWARANMANPAILADLQAARTQIGETVNNGQNTQPTGFSAIINAAAANASGTTANNGTNVNSHFTTEAAAIAGVMGEEGEFDILMHACRPTILENKMPIRLNVIHEMHPPEALMQGLREQLGFKTAPNTAKRRERKARKAAAIDKAASKGAQNTKKGLRVVLANLEFIDSIVTPTQRRFNYGVWYMPPTEWKNLEAKRGQTKLGGVPRKKGGGVGSVVQAKLDEIMANREQEEKNILAGVSKHEAKRRSVTPGAAYNKGAGQINKPNNTNRRPILPTPPSPPSKHDQQGVMETMVKMPRRGGAAQSDTAASNAGKSMVVPIAEQQRVRSANR